MWGPRNLCTVSIHYPVVRHGKIKDGWRAFEGAFCNSRQPTHEWDRYVIISGRWFFFHVVLPQGFPPGDEAVPGFLIRQPFDQNDAYIRSHAFLTSLFTVTYTILQEIEEKLENTNTTEGNRYKTLTKIFREHMRFGQTFKKHGQHRVQFYEKVIRLANEVSLFLKFLYTVKCSLSIAYERQSKFR